jgi:hypothetical protein
MAPDAIRYEDAAERRTVEGWVCKKCRRWWADDEHMARWCCSSDQPCACGARRSKNYTICDGCREKKELERWEQRERRPYDGRLLYSDTLSRYFDDAEDVADWLAGEDEGGHTYESLRLLLCDKQYAREIDGDDFFTDDLPEDCTLDDVASDIAEAIGAVNDVIAQRRKDGRQISWFPSKYAVDISTLPALESPPALDAVDPHVTGSGKPTTRA